MPIIFAYIKMNIEKFLGCPLLILTAALSLCACGNSVTPSDSPAVPAENINDTVDTAPLPETEDIDTNATSLETTEPNWVRQPDAEFDPLFERLCDERNMSKTDRDILALTIKGDGHAQKWIFDSDIMSDGAVWLFYRHNLKNLSETGCLYGIGKLYFEGDQWLHFEIDKTTALEWFKLSAIRGSADGAVKAGDMLRDGDGVEKDTDGAFKYYSIAADLAQNGVPFARLADCYRDGIGVAADSQMAYHYYLDSAFLSYPPALFELTKYGNKDGTDLIALYKAAGRSTRPGRYFAAVYSGIFASYYERIGVTTADLLNQEIVKYLHNIWKTKADDVVKNINIEIPYNKTFPKSLVEDLMKASYTYGYRAFVEKYALLPNRVGSEENADIKFYETAGGYESLKDVKNYYLYDFNHDGKLEIGIPYHYDNNGVIIYDEFVIDQVIDGMVTFVDHIFADEMRIIKYNERIYFITNPFSRKGKDIETIEAYTLDSSGWHTLIISWKDYKTRKVLTQTSPEYLIGYEELLSTVDSNWYHRLRMVDMPDKNWGLKQSDYQKDSDAIWSVVGDEGLMFRKDEFFIEDIDNNGKPQVIHKGRNIAERPRHHDYYWFYVYNKEAFDVENMKIVQPNYNDDYWAEHEYDIGFVRMHSGGNLYELFPVKYDVIDFWTESFAGKTYCVTLQKFNALYVTNIFLIQNNVVERVSRSMYIEEPQSPAITFE